jgi:phosphatidylglycerophosphate synthase
MTTAFILPPTRASFFKVAGLPVVQRIAISALRGGCDTVVAFGGDDAGRLREAFRRHRLTRTLQVIDRAPMANLARQRALVLPSDWLVTPQTVQRVLERKPGGDPVLFHLQSAGHDGRGLMLCRTDLLDRVVPGLGQDACRGAGEPNLACISAARVAIADGACHPIQTEADAKEAERALIRDLRASTADTDGPIARFDRALSTRLSRLLVHTPLRPNHITTIGTLIGLLGGWCFGRGTYASNLLGAVLFWFAVIIDGCDGEVARLKFQETRYGGLYDVVTDNIVHVAIFLGLAIGHFRFVPGSYARLFAGLLLGGFFCALTATYFCFLRHPPVKHLQPRSRRGRIRQGLLRGFEALMNRDFAYLLIPLAIIDRLGWFLWGSAFGTYAYAAGLVWIYRWRDAE